MLSADLSNPFQRGRGGPGGWWILPEPGIELPRSLALTQAGGSLAADAKKLKLGDALADVARTTDALAKGLGRGTGDKRRPPSRKLRSAVAECAASFNGVHEDLVWFVGRTPPGAERDKLHALLVPLDALLSRHAPGAAAAATPAEATPLTPAEPAKPVD